MRQASDWDQLRQAWDWDKLRLAWNWDKSAVSISGVRLYFEKFINIASDGVFHLDLDYTLLLTVNLQETSVSYPLNYRLLKYVKYSTSFENSSTTSIDISALFISYTFSVKVGQTHMTTLHTTFGTLTLCTMTSGI